MNDNPLQPASSALTTFSSEGIDQEILRKLQGFIDDREAYSENTWRQLISAFRAWGRWCWQHDYPYLPIQPEPLREYVLFMKQRLTVSSVRQHLAMLGMLQRQGGLLPAGQHPIVTRVVKKISRMAVENGERIGQAIPFHVTDLKAVAAIWAGSEQLTEARNLAYLSIAYNTLLRMSEISRLKVGDINFSSNGPTTIYIGRTKTIISGDGLVKALSNFTTTHLRHWLIQSGLLNQPDAYIFCRVNKSNRVISSNEKTLSAVTLESIFKSGWLAVKGPVLADRQGGRYSTWTGHSARVGAAQDMAKNDVSLPKIMHEGTWKKPETVMRYIRNLEASKSAMLDILGE